MPQILGLSLMQLTHIPSGPQQQGPRPQPIQPGRESMKTNESALLPGLHGLLVIRADRR